MVSEIKFHTIAPVLPSSDIERDIKWHANSKDDPLLGGSVIKIFMTGIDTLFQEFLIRKTVSKNKLRYNTPWSTHEFGFYDLNKNVIFFVENA